jgi:uncharacterized membrane protein (DUF4010 family)
MTGYIADRILTQNGFKVLNVTGGYRNSRATSTAILGSISPFYH